MKRVFVSLAVGFFIVVTFTAAGRPIDMLSFAAGVIGIVVADILDDII